MEIRIIDKVTSNGHSVSENLYVSGIDKNNEIVNPFVININGGGSYENNHSLAFQNQLTDENMEIIAGETIVSDKTYYSEMEYFTCGWMASVDKKIAWEFGLNRSNSQSWNSKTRQIED